MGLLACLAAALLAGIVISQLDTSKVTDEIYLQTGTPAPSAGRLMAAPEHQVEADGKRPSLGHVSRPSSPPTSEARPSATPTATRQRSSIDGSGSEVPAGTSVGTASDGQGGDDQEDAPATGELEAAAVDLTNRERMRNGCDPLRVDPRLARSARAHSRDMAARNYFSHTSPGGLTPWNRMARAGYSNSAAENIARGYQSADEAVRGWMSNSGHRRNILNCKITTVGIGVAYGSGDTWWTQDFGYS
ncbi:CAP domain-containing protein [Sphaerisporangium sp. NPDC088356]|uniref:CAP domain-containing protein n=1 Tax=Sphaerisporangium sp. NPDC088356 TaxID=3154871 RepID=UPI003413340F